MNSRTIPIRNIFYLLCYAWGHFHEGSTISVGAEQSPSLVDLLALALINGIKRLKRRGLDRGYVPQLEEISGIKGRINLDLTLKRALVRKGQASCLFDDLSFDVAHNRILRATVRRLSNVPELDAVLRHQLLEIDRELTYITPVALDRSSFRQIQLHRNNAYYDLLLKICELIHDSLLPTEQQGHFKFADLAEDETRLSQLFEDFIRNFYAREQTAYPSVKREKVMWFPLESSETAKQHIPEMVTDVTLRNPSEVLVVEAKFYREVFIQYQGARRIRSPHLYQLFAYLKNIGKEGQEAPNVRGMLLYATGGENLTFDYEIGNVAIRVATVSLAESWVEIHARLVELLQPSVTQLAS